MTITICDNAMQLGEKAASKIAELIRNTLKEKDSCNLLLSTGQSQFETLDYLIKEDIDWTKIEMFHLDEYLDLPDTHPASFRRYLKERFVSKIKLKDAHFVEDEESIEKLSKIIKEKPIDIGVIGIGENGHIAFNDPPADFDTEEIYKLVSLDEKCRNQQVREGWFKSIEEVPLKAITMTPRAIMASKHIVSAVPHSVKADAVYKTICEKVSPELPATLLKTHPDWSLYIDANSASKLLNY